MRAALAARLGERGVDEAAVRTLLDKSVFDRADRAYGASRELLLRENHDLRAQLREKGLTPATAWAGPRAGSAGAGWFKASSDGTSAALGGAAEQARRRGAGGVALKPWNKC